MIAIVKRSLACMLAFILTVSAVPVYVYAQESEGQVEDGSYIVPVEMWNASSDKLSMAAGTLEGKGKLVISEGEARLNIVFQEANIMGMSAYLSEFHTYNDFSGDKTDLLQAEYLSFLDADNTCLKEVSIPVETGASFTYVKMFVPLMNTYVDARIYVEYANLQEYSETDRQSWDEKVTLFESLTQERYTLESYETVAAMVAEAKEAIKATYTPQAEIDSRTETLSYALKRDLVLNVADGSYEIDGYLWHATKDQASMATGIISLAELEIKDGAVQVILNTQQLTVYGQTAYVDKLQFLAGESYVEADITGRELENENVSQFCFTLPEAVGLTTIQVYYNGRWTDARLYLDFETLSQKEETVKPEVTVNLNMSSATVYDQGDQKTVTLEATVTETESDVAWKSSDTGVAAVSSAGVVTGKKAGTAVITAEADGVSAQCEVTVKARTLKLSSTKATIYTTQQKTVTLKATLTGSTGKVTWKSSDINVAAVSSSGTVTAKKAGTAVITATADGVSAKCTVQVKTISLKLNKTKSTIYTAGKKTVTLVPTIVGPSTKVTWKSDNTKIATVNSKGVVTAKKTGTVKITATANGIKKTCTVTIKKPSLTVSKTSISVKRGNTAAISAKATPATTIKYKSGNTKIATVSSKGVIKGIKKGTVKITVSCNGIKKTVTVKVK